MKKILAVFAVFGGVLMSADIEDTTLKAIFENFEKSSKNDTIQAGLSPRQIELSNLAVIIASGLVYLCVWLYAFNFKALKKLKEFSLFI